MRWPRSRRSGDDPSVDERTETHRAADEIRERLRTLGYGHHISLIDSGEAEFLRRVARSGFNGVAVDVGAHDGRYSRLLAENGFASVTMVEPHPLHREALTALGAETGYATLGVAASDTEGMAVLHFGRTDLQLASLEPDLDQLWFVDNDEAVEVPSTTLDAIWRSQGRPSIDLLKIDTEGWEREVLIGAAELLSEDPPRFVQLEVSQALMVRGSSLLSLSQLLPENSRCFQLLHGVTGMRPVDVRDPLSNVFEFANFIFTDAEHAAAIDA